jgi:hypothetical protein
VSDYLERDENYEPATLPSAGELLHWGDLHGPEPKPSIVAPEGDFTRFPRRRSTFRTLVAALVSIVAVVGGAWGVSWLTAPGGPSGFGPYFGGIAAVIVAVVILVRTWKWANVRRAVIPTL